ncbi:hypothetical protein BJ742DRAFT_780716 [Cladochytrium replicatum]|nr:hypothetical protein BJ742DRAFT_780716 [Cladochytrium replicatum]
MPSTRDIQMSSAREHPKEDKEHTVAELANQAPKRETRTGLLPGVPFVIALPLLFLFAMTLGIVPSLVTVLGTAQSSIDDMTTKIVESTTLAAALSFTTMLKEIQRMTTVFTDAPVVYNYFSTQTYNYGNNNELNLFADTIFSQSNGAPVFREKDLCDPSIETPAPEGSWNETYYALIYPGIFCWLDYNATTSWCDVFNRTTGQRIPQYRFRNPSLMADKVYFATSNPSGRTILECPFTGEWEAVLGEKNALYLDYSRCPTKETGKMGSYLCITIFQPDYRVLESSSPDGINRMFLITLEDKLGLANVVNISVANANKTDFVEVTNASDPVIADLGKSLLSYYGGGVSKFPYFNSTTFKADSVINDFVVPSDNGNVWATTAVRLRSGIRDDFALVVAMPRSQFTRDIDASKTKGTILAILFAVLGLVMGVALTLLATWPLKTMTKNMEKATKLDFSMLESGKFNESNFFLEIRNMQRTFNTMIKAFAGAIKNNRNLMTGQSGSKQTDRSMMAVPADRSVIAL